MDKKTPSVQGETNEVYSTPKFHCSDRGWHVNTTIMTIGHHPAVVALHKRHLELSPEGDHFTLRDIAKRVAVK